MHRREMAAIEQVLQRERPPYRAVSVRPVSPIIGAEIEGVDLSAPLSKDETAELRQALLEHHVLVFRDQAITQAEHLRVAAIFGFRPEPGVRQVTIPAHDDVVGAEPVMLAESWRADETYRRTPPAGGVLHIHKLPRLGTGGDMMFANMHLAYDVLSDPLKVLLADLTAIHAPNPLIRETDDANMTAEHSVVTRHPVTGRPALFVNRRHTSHIVQISARHSQATLDMLCRHVETRPVLTCRIRWTPNALVVWDNRSTQHLTLQDFRPKCLSGEFVSFAGEAPARYSG